MLHVAWQVGDFTPGLLCVQRVRHLSHQIYAAALGNTMASWLSVVVMLVAETRKQARAAGSAARESHDKPYMNISSQVPQALSM